MNINNAKKLLAAQDEGFRIKISSRYVDGFARYVDGFARLHEDESGNVLLSSSVYSDLKIESVHLQEISIYKEVAIEEFINWNDEK